MKLKIVNKTSKVYQTLKNDQISNSSTLNPCILTTWISLRCVVNVLNYRSKLKVGMIFSNEWEIKVKLVSTKIIFRFFKIYIFFLTKAKQLKDVVKDGNEENLEIYLCFGEEKTPSII